MPRSPRSPRSQSPLRAPAATVLALLAWSCAVPTGPAVERVPDASGVREASAAALVPPPLQLAGTAYEAAADVVLPEVPAGNYPGLHNVFRLSDQIISGSEPHDEEALAQVAAWGVRTILSVDGKGPEVDTAAGLGMRYVHVPLQYKGIDAEQLANIAKTFHELEGPFYVHCFHGKHRGPAAAAIGRVALDGLSRDRAIAEMRQWCSTAGKYEGLYASVATATIPSPAQTATHDFDFVSSRSFGGLREVMIGMTRTIDEVKIVRANDWKPSVAHPDIDPLRSATHLAELYAAATNLDECASHPDDFHEMLQEGKSGIDDLVQFLTDCRQDTSEGALATRLDAMEDAFDRTYESCLDCHVGYRNGSR